MHLDRCLRAAAGKRKLVGVPERFTRIGNVAELAQHLGTIRSGATRDADVEIDHEAIAERPVAFDEVDQSSGLVRKRAGNDQAGKAPARAEIDPHSCVWSKLKELQRIGNVPRPKMRNRGRRDEIRSLLPFQQQGNEVIEPCRGFT